MSISPPSLRRHAPPVRSSMARVTQGRFLAALGAEARLAKLSAGATEAQRAALESGLARLIDPLKMGNLFKVLALTSPGLPARCRF